jgi:tetratricopeptide (TPR) repeat protein
MARSFTNADANAVPAQLVPFNHAASKTYFQIVQRSSSFFHRRWQVGNKGEEIHAEELEIHYVMGSGNHARTFLHRNARGALIELPLGWYAENGGFYAMSPGFDSPHPETRRKIGFECMACHNAYPSNATKPQAGAEPVYGTELPQGIDCERCHGPGAKHVKLATVTGSPRELIRRAIVNPARLPRDRQTEVCLQCHLETTSTRLPAMIRRFDRGPFSFTPGESLNDHVLHFDHPKEAGREDKFEIVSAAYRMRQSACFLKSKTLTCTTCHSAHGESKINACSNCHSQASLAAARSHPGGSDCAGCHMPKRRTEDAVHVVMTDHFIQRIPSKADPLAERKERHPAESEEYRGEVVPYYPQALLELREGPLYAAVAQVLQGANLQAGVEQLQRELARHRPREPEFYVTLGNAWQQLHRPDKATEAFRAAINLNPKAARPHRFLGIALQEREQPAAAKKALEQALLLDPRDAVSWYQLALLDSLHGKLQEAAAKARKAITLDPDLLDAHNTLGVSLSRAGEAKAAEKAFREALRINPYFATAHGNLARLLADTGDVGSALEHFRESVRLRPDFAPDRYNLALTLIRVGRFDEAHAQAEETVRLAPRMAEARMLLGGLFARSGRLPQARLEYTEAIRISPNFGRAHLDLARVLAAQGDRAAAIEHLKMALVGDDASAAQLATKALQHLGVPLPNH